VKDIAILAYGFSGPLCVEVSQARAPPGIFKNSANGFNVFTGNQYRRFSPFKRLVSDIVAAYEGGFTIYEEELLVIATI